MSAKFREVRKLLYFHTHLPPYSLSTLFLPKSLMLKVFCYSTSSASSRSALSETIEEVIKDHTGPAELFRKCGCSDADISKILHRAPSLIKSNRVILEPKLNLLQGMGITGSDFVKIVHSRPRFFACRIAHGLDERITFLQTLFGSKEILLKAIVRNPSLLYPDLQNKIKRCVSIYQELGISKEELVPMLISRPTLIPRTALDDDKLEFIRSIGLPSDSKMYKYVVTLIAVSHLQTIYEKVANLEKFGFSSDEVMGLFGRSPLVFTLSVDKVQRNMTFVIGTMKLPRSVILRHPFLLFSNLESILRPRFLLSEKIREIGLLPQIKGPAMLRALRMTEARFLKAFVTCHDENVSHDLVEFYTKAKGIKRLAVNSKRAPQKGFPF